MKNGSRGLTRVLATLYLVAIHLALVYLLGERLAARYVNFSPLNAGTVSDPTEEQKVPTPEAVPELLVYDASPTQIPAATDTVGLLIPVQGVRADQLVDTFSASRAGGRSHDAIDIMAPAGTPVVAAADGKIVKFFDSIPGGVTIYQASADETLIYYYGHLQRRADDLKEGDLVKQGRVIGYVGDTGNAGAGNYHLHFSIARTTDPKRYWEGSYINPYEFLKSGRAPQ